MRCGAESFESPVVINVAGPHSSQITSLVQAQRDMSITTRPMRVEPSIASINVHIVI